MLTTEDRRLAELRKKVNEDDAEFMKRFPELARAGGLARWKQLTSNGTVYGGNAVRRFM